MIIDQNIAGPVLLGASFFNKLLNVYPPKEGIERCILESFSIFLIRNSFEVETIIKRDVKYENEAILVLKNNEIVPTFLRMLKQTTLVPRSKRIATANRKKGTCFK